MWLSRVPNLHQWGWGGRWNLGWEGWRGGGERGRGWVRGGGGCGEKRGGREWRRRSGGGGCGGLESIEIIKISSSKKAIATKISPRL